MYKKTKKTTLEHTVDSKVLTPAFQTHGSGCEDGTGILQQENKGRGIDSGGHHIAGQKSGESVIGISISQIAHLEDDTVCNGLKSSDRLFSSSPIVARPEQFGFKPRCRRYFLHEKLGAIHPSAEP